MNQWTRTQGRRRAIVTALLGLAVAFPAVGHAQQTMNAQVLTAQGIALTAAELGPEWTVAKNQSLRIRGFDRYDALFGAPSGRAISITTAVADDPELAEEVISVLRYALDDMGLTISSVQNQGFGDGRAFRAHCTCPDGAVEMYLFRVRQLVAWVQYRGAVGASDVTAQAQSVARKQERKMFAALAPPPAAPTPLPVPTAPPTPAPTPVAVTPAAPPVVATAPADPYCKPGEQPQFRFGFAALRAQLGARMGEPTSCEYGDPAGSGDTLQNTSTGLSFYRARTNTPTFTTGFEHWALTSTGTVYWTGDGIDPPPFAPVFEP